jgi:hypothetical protein
MLLQTPTKEKKGGKKNELPKTSSLFLHPSLKHKSVTAHSKQSDPNPEESHKMNLKRTLQKRGEYPPHTYIHEVHTFFTRCLQNQERKGYKCDACTLKAGEATHCSPICPTPRYSSMLVNNQIIIIPQSRSLSLSLSSLQLYRSVSFRVYEDGTLTLTLTLLLIFGLKCLGYSSRPYDPQN